MTREETIVFHLEEDLQNNIIIVRHIEGGEECLAIKVSDSGIVVFRYKGATIYHDMEAFEQFYELLEVETVL